MELSRYIESKIDKPLGRLRGEEELEWVLRRRLTKKEFKVLQGTLQGTSEESIKSKLKLDDERLDRIRENIRHKLNQDRIKLELYNTGAAE
jgi:FixJ family two-component response regulator